MRVDIDKLEALEKVATPLTTDEIAYHLHYHQPIPWRSGERQICNHDDQWWPCDLVRAFATIAARDREVRELRGIAEAARKANFGMSDIDLAELRAALAEYDAGGAP